MDLNGKVALVTGATSGIGKETAKALSNAGAKLVLTGRRESLLKELADELGAAECLAGDITDPSLPERLVALAQEKFGGLDILVNNAGMMLTAGVGEVDIEEVTAMVRVNVEAAFRVAYTALKVMTSKGSGFVVNVSSIAGYKTGPGTAAYNGTKFAVEAFSDALRIELADTGVQVAAIAPGTVATNLYDSWSEQDKEYMFSGGALDAADIARAICFILQQPEHMTVARMLAVPRKQPI